MKGNKKIIKNHDISSAIGKNIRFFRKKQGLSLKLLAKKIGVSPQQLQKYETGTNRISAGKLHKTSLILETPIDQFFIQINSKNLLQEENETDVLLRYFNKIHSKKIRKLIIENILFYTQHGA